MFPSVKNAALGGKLAAATWAACFALAPSALYAQAASAAGPLTADAAARLSQNVNRPVIVIMKNRLAGTSALADQAPLMNELHQVGAQNLKSYRLVNAIAATVSDGEFSRLAANPAVERVVPDVILRHSPRPLAAGPGASADAAKSLPLNTLPGTCRANGKVQLNPEALLTTNTDSDNPKALTARSLGITGAGVKVAWIADGIDTRNANFIRPNGTPVFIDYKDFTGDGPGAQTAGGEAFLDANSIAGQGDVIYDVNHYVVDKLHNPCPIRIEGVAPGASLVGLDVFGTFEATTESNFLQAIDYAVTVDHVDVLNESFGSNGIPDSGANDATRLFDEAAVAAGTTVVVSSGDAGPTSTIGSPSTDPLVIGVGATTTFRLYAQTNEGSARYFATTGWLDDNISALSSGGYTEGGRTVDMVAPGDLNWVSCTPSPIYADCTNLFGKPTRFEDSGGTSESAPLTSGAAALVIEAYRNFHDGASPSPALVKQILTSTASDLGVPATEQGAGILNTYKAVQLAESIHDKNGGPARVGHSLLLSQDQLNAVDMPGKAHSWPVKITNAGSVNENVVLNGETLGPDENVQNGSVLLSDGSDQQFISFTGVPENYVKFNFTVPSGADHMTASIAYPPSNPAGKVASLSLVDPKGRYAAYSLAQGVGNHGFVDVRAPVPGTWTGIIFSRTVAVGGIQGTVPWQVATQRFVPFGSVSPSSLNLAPGQSQSVQVTATTPASPGDTSGSIVVSSSGAGVDPYLGKEHGSVSVTLRSKVDLAHGGAFSGVLTGGNGRAGVPGQVSYYAFEVGPKATGITANVSLTSDFADTVGAYLVGPDGAAVGFGQNSVNGVNGPSLTASTLNPAPGLWTLIVVFTQPVVGDEISQPFTGNIVLNQVNATAPALPNSASTTLAAGVPVTVPVTITNNGAAPEAVFFDARLNDSVSMTLASQSPPPSKEGYPLPVTSAEPEWLVPTQTSSVQVEAHATLPVEFDFGPFQGDPDVVGAPSGKHSAAGSYAPSGGVVQPGYWYALPSEIGPYSGPAPSGFAKVSMTATFKPFDRSVTSATSDLWLASIGALKSFAPVTLNPGQSVTLDVKVKPSGAEGSVVTGTLYVDSFISDVPPGQTTANEVAALPYTYTVGAAPSGFVEDDANGVTKASVRVP